MLSTKEQLFYIYSEQGQRLGMKDREAVHHDGDWHRGVQLNLFNNGDLLMQRRSGKVDIAKGLMDQSLATQLLVRDRESDMIALQRGLKTELSMDIADLDIRPVSLNRKIIKRYAYDSTLLNCEFVSLYEAQLASRDVVSNNPKVAELFWMPLPQVKKLAAWDKSQFTKTFLMWLEEVM